MSQGGSGLGGGVWPVGSDYRYGDGLRVRVDDVLPYELAWRLRPTGRVEHHTIVVRTKSTEAGHIWASSVGRSFTVPASVGTLSVTARWSR